MTMSAARAGSADPSGGPWAAGLATAAGVLMITGGMFQAFEGLAALINGDFFVEVGDYAFDVDVTVYGWGHLILGLAIAVTGGFVITGAIWARVVGIGVAMFSAFGNFLFIPYYPFWAILIITFDVFIIWALAVYNPAARQV
jgi:hypothetical protein